MVEERKKNRYETNLHMINLLQTEHEVRNSVTAMAMSTTVEQCASEWYVDCGDDYMQSACQITDNIKKSVCQYIQRIEKVDGGREPHICVLLSHVIDSAVNFIKHSHKLRTQMSQLIEFVIHVS